MAQIIKHRRGSLESLSSVTGSLQKGELVIASGSSNITASNGSSIVFAVPESGSVKAVNRVLRGTNAPNTFPASTYNGMLDGVPYYASASATLYLLGGDTNEAINLVGNIQPFSTSVDSRLDAVEVSLGGGASGSIGVGDRVTSLEIVSASLNTFSASVLTRLTEVGVVTGSLISSASADRVSITNLNTFSSSQLTKDSTLQTYTASVDTRLTEIGVVSGSLISSASAAAISNTNQNTFTASALTRLSNLETTSASVNTSVSNINSYTSSLQAAVTASGRNVTFSNDVTVQGNLTVKGATTSVESTTLNIGDNIINLNGSNVANGGIYVSDPTAPNTGTGSMLWDSTNNYWKAGFSGSESKVLLAGGDSVFSGSSQVQINDTTGFSTFSSSVANSVSNINTSISASGIWFATGSVFSTTNNLEVTGSLTVSGSIKAVGAMTASNINVGTPTSNAWGSNLGGSYFNNFTSNTDVSEILRFVAGLLSSSAPDASPNTRTFSSVTATAVNTTTGTALTGRIPQSTTNSTISYLASKGFATAGSTIFSGIGTIYTANLGYNYTSVAAGTTTATSSADAQLFGLGNLSSGTPTNFKVSGSFTFRFMDNSSKTSTSTSSSAVLITQSGEGTTSGVTLAKINTVNPNVIPPAYQDGKFVSTLTQYLYSGSATAISASGYYHISSSISIASGSSGYSTAVAANGSEIFYAPLTTIATNVPAQTTYTASLSTLSYATAVSRSLSGAPYLSQSTYIVSSSISGAFAPLFLNGTVAAHSLSGTGMTSTSGVTSVATSGGTISTANAVYDSTNTTVRATGTIPFATDLIRLNGLYTFGGSNITNIGQSSNTPTTFTVSAVGYDYNGNADTYGNTLSYHVAGTFGQPASSGSLAYYTRTQGADSSTALVESFTGESYRIALADNVLAFNGAAWTTTFGLYNLTGNDLQVKPGYLVKPGGTYGYWLGDPDATKTYKYYIRKFTTSGTKTSMTLNLGQALVNWGNTTNNSVAAGILFESSKNTIYTPARIFDPSNLTDNFTATKTANTDGQNPFGANFDLYGNTGGSLASTTYTIPLRNGDGMTLNATYTNIYVIVRYKGDPTPVTSITTTFS